MKVNFNPTIDMITDKVPIAKRTNPKTDQKGLFMIKV